MKLLRLRLRNFKGTKEFILETQGHNVNVFGDNASGKTTLQDAFLWVLFDKDSANRKDFAIKTLDANGQELHGLEHSVEAVLELDNGKRITLRKVFTEKWTKKRGSASPVFTGHTTDYFIDGVPVQKKEYDARIAEIADEAIFKLLTSPTYFNEQLHWTERRKILLQVCGDVSDEDVIASDNSLARLPEILQGRKLDDHRKVIQARRAEINKELDRLPVRIDEITRGLPDITDINAGIIPGQIADLKARIRAKNEEIARIEGGGQVAEKVKDLREVEARLLDIRTRHRSEVEDRTEARRRELRSIKDTISNLQRDIRDKERTLEGNNRLIIEAEAKAAKLREEWYAVNGRQFEYSQDSTCPTCGQPIPEEKLAAAREKALADFNRTKAETLERISAQGKALKADIERLRAENAAIESEIAGLNEKLAGAEQEAATIQKAIDDMARAAGDVTENPEYVQAMKEKESLEAEIAELKAGNAGRIVAVKSEIALLENEITDLEKTLARVDQYQKGQARIRELQAQEKALAAEYERLEKELYLTDLFTKAKVSLLEDKIASKFKLTRFKMYTELINGGVEPCCEALYNGVPFSGGLNNGHRILVGLDIINTLSEHYGFTAPIFIDNREAVTKLIETRGQLISLIVSEKDPSLRVEVDTNAIAS
jgi:DNA repair exonuclease SbcCD ATPase subunit